MKSWSLQKRLLIGMGLVAAMVVLVSGLLVTGIRHEMIEQVDQRLDALSANEPTRDDGRTKPDSGRGPDRDRDGSRFERSSDIYEGVVDEDGNLVDRFTPTIGDDTYSQPVLDDLGLRPESDRGGRAIRYATVPSADGQATYRVALRPFDGGYAVTAIPIDNLLGTIRSLQLISLLGALAIFVVLAVVSWWVVRLGIRPINTMTQNATAIAAGDLSVRIDPAPEGTEAGELSDALNLMIGNITTAMDQQARSEQRLRQFVSDASHELRTPVTTIRGYAELYRHGGLTDPANLDDAMRRTEQESARMGRLVEDMLSLARLDERRPMSFGPVHVAGLLDDLAADARVLDPDRTISVDVDAADPLIVSGDGDRVRQAVLNVLTNARVHTDGDIELTAAPKPGADGRDGVEIEIVDHGRGMTAEEVDRATERFYRADPSRSRARGGSGLGLAIADGIVGSHRGELTIRSERGTGTTVAIWLPTPGQDESPD